MSVIIFPGSGSGVVQEGMIFHDGDLFFAGFRSEIVRLGSPNI